VDEQLRKLAEGFNGLRAVEQEVVGLLMARHAAMHCLRAARTELIRERSANEWVPVEYLRELIDQALRILQDGWHGQEEDGGTNA